LPDIFSDDEIRQMTEYMRIAVEEAKKALKEGKVSASSFCTFESKLA